MKLALLIVAASATSVHADPENAIIADVGLHVVGLGFQRTVAEHLALQIDAESYTPWTHETKFFDAQGFLVRARPFYYVTAAPRGIWISPFVQIGAVRGTQNGVSESGLAWAVGAAAGYAWLVRDRVHVLLGAGVQYDVAHLGDTSMKPSFNGLWPQLDGSLGYAF
jgi:hypothetical protein